MRHVLIAFLLTVVLGGPVAAQTCAVPLRAMTYNIRYDNPDDGADGWAHRRDNVAAQIRFAAPDIAGMQEVLANQKADLVSRLPGYAIIGNHRDDGHQAGEASPIAVRQDRWIIRAHGLFWLSPTPLTPSKGWDADQSRIATWARLASRGGRVRILAVNTHFDHRGSVARAESAKLIRDWIGKNAKPGEAIVLMGDFNTYADTPALSVLSSTFKDTRTASLTPPFGPPGTFNGFDLAKRDSKAIDHIFADPGMTVQAYSVLEQTVGGRLISDHYPVVADLRLRNRCQR